MMTVSAATKNEIRQHIKDLPDQVAFDKFIRATPEPYVGVVDGALVCIWGLVPPTMMSDRAYLWLYTTEALKGNEFVFIRHSQRWLEEALKEFPTIIGHASGDAPQSIRWIRLCGGVFHEPDEGSPLLPFTIRKKH